MFQLLPPPMARLAPLLALACVLLAGSAAATPLPSPQAPATPAPASAVAASLEALPSRFASLDGVKVHYKVAGDSPVALVLVHGWTCDLGFFREQLPMARDLRLLLVDLPGHGRSGMPASFSMDLFAKAVEAAMRDAGIEKAFLAGHSMGTAVARQVYRLFPWRVRGLVALDGALRSYFDSQEKVDAYVAPLEGAGGRAAFLKKVDGMLPATTAPAIREYVRISMTRTRQETAAGAARAMFDLAIWADDAIQVPLLLVLARSPWWDAGYRAHVRKLAPSAGFVELDGVSHFLMLEKPEAVNAALLGFCAGGAR